MVVRTRGKPRGHPPKRDDEVQNANVDATVTDAKPDNVATAANNDLRGQCSNTLNMAKDGKCFCPGFANLTCCQKKGLSCADVGAHDCARKRIAKTCANCENTRERRSQLPMRAWLEERIQKFEYSNFLEYLFEFVWWSNKFGLIYSIIFEFVQTWTMDA